MFDARAYSIAFIFNVHKIVLRTANNDRCPEQNISSTRILNTVGWTLEPIYHIKIDLYAAVCVCV